ncbi:hypothetical protein MFLAVUS_004712 [Mucor flavus]|uniref:F-box domain-containing protein n=1 Tax=Mucor flavus TaxID=439312 RepID=A0ABP9YWS1_9FUNG
MNELPPEVYYRIFAHLSRPEILACSFVCKRLNVAAVQVYSKELIIDDYKFCMAKSNLASDNHSRYFRNGHLVRKLVFKSESEDAMKDFGGSLKAATKKKGMPPNFSRVEFLLLLQYLPNIEEIDFTKSGYFKYYISYLSDASLRHIKKIAALPFESYLFSSPGYQEYFFTCLRFCDTLTCLCFRYVDTTNDYSYRGIDILERLGQFKNLKQLIFHNKHHNDLIMFRIRDLCPQLTELKFKSDYTYSPQVQESLDQNNQPILQLNKSLQHLTIILRSLSIDYTKYLTSYINDGLYKLNVSTSLIGLYSWIDQVGMEDALKLMRRLGQLDDVCVSFMQRNRLRRAHLTDRLKMTKWFQVVNAFKGNRKVVCTIVFRKIGVLHDYFKYNSLDNRLVLGYALEDVDYFGELEEGHTEHFDGRLPTGPISTVGLETIDRLILNLRQPEDAFILSFLKYAFTNCLNLRHLKVSSYLHIQGRPNQRNGDLDDIQNNLNMAHFICGAPNNNMLHVISVYLQNIEILVFGSNSSSDNLILRLTCFKNLKQSYFIIQDISKPLSVKFEYPDGKEQSYYYYDGSLIREDEHDASYSCQSFTFVCKRDTNFTVCFGSNESLMNFCIDTIQVAAQVYSRTLILDNNKIQKANIYFERDISHKYFKYGYFVRKLIFKSDAESTGRDPHGTETAFPTVFHRGDFLSLFKHFPNIEEIDLTGSNDRIAYISYLRDANLQHIKKISELRFSNYATSGVSYRNYLSTCFKYHGTLTSLSLEYTRNTKDYTFCGVGVLDMLSQFKNLKNLVFYNSYSDNEIMFQIQILCPQLTELTFDSKYDGPFEAVEESLDQETEAIVKLNKNLQHLKINSLSLSVDYTKYLTSFIEDGLSTVHIKVTATGLCDWMETVGIENGLKLMTKLGQLNDVNISFMQCRRTRKIYMLNALKMTRWFQLVNAFKGGNKAFCNVKFCGSGCMQDHFEYDALENQLYLVYGFEEAEDYEDENPLLSFTLPDRSLSTIGPEIINQLELSLSEPVESNILNFLEYGFKNCINLQYLEVESCLVIQGCTEEKIGAIDDIQNNLNMVHFQNGVPTADLLDMIYTHLPDIELLIFGSDGSNYTMKLDLTPFKSLKRCYFILQQACTDSYKSVSINFEYQDGKEQWHCYDGKSKEYSVVENKRTFGYYCQSFTFLCNNNDIEFTVCSDSNYSLSNFNIDKLPGSCYHIPKYSTAGLV